MSKRSCNWIPNCSSSRKAAEIISFSIWHTAYPRIFSIQTFHFWKDFFFSSSSFMVGLFVILVGLRNNAQFIFSHFFLLTRSRKEADPELYHSATVERPKSSQIPSVVTTHSSFWPTRRVVFVCGNDLSFARLRKLIVLINLLFPLPSSVLFVFDSGTFSFSRYIYLVPVGQTDVANFCLGWFSFSSLTS